MATNDSAVSNLRFNTVSQQLEYALNGSWFPVPTAPGGITQLTSDVTAGPGSGSQAATLATVNSNVGSFTNTNLTVNAKGLITAASNGTGGGATITNWAAYTPTIVGVGSDYSNVDFRWKQIGDTIYVSGIYLSGTTGSAPVSITLPNSFTIKYGTAGMSTTQDLVGFAAESNTQAVFTGNGAAIVTDGSTTDKVFVCYTGVYGSPFIPASSQILDVSAYIAVNFWFVHA